MTNSLIDTNHLCQQLLKQYLSLSPAEQTIIQLLALIYEPVKRTQLLNCLSSLSGIAEKYQPGSLNSVIMKLVKTELVMEKGAQIQCHPLFIEIATRDSIKVGRFTAMADVIAEKMPISTYSGSRQYFSNPLQFFRQVRLGIYRQDIDFINKQIEDYNAYYSSKRISLEEVLRTVCNNPFDAEWFSTLSPELFETALVSIISNATMTMSPADEAFDLLYDECLEAGKHCSDFLRLLLTEQLLLRGDLPAAQLNLEQISDDYRQEAAFFWGWLNFVRGDDQKAGEIYAAVKTYKKSKAKQKVNFPSLSELIFVLFLLKDGSGECLREAEAYVSKIIRQSQHWLKPAYIVLQSVIKLQMGDLSQKDIIYHTYLSQDTENQELVDFFSALALYWGNVDIAKNRLPKIIEALYEQADNGGYYWIAIEAGELISRFKPRSQYGKKAAALRKESNISLVLADLVRTKEAWELCLNALANLDKEPQITKPVESEMRLAWFISLSTYSCSIQPKEQKANAKGIWSKGRPIALKRLSQDSDEFKYLTTQDLRVCACIEAIHENSGYYGKTDYVFNEKAIIALIGHPCVFWEESPTMRVEIVKGEPELIVKKEGEDCLTLEFSPKIQSINSVITLRETPSRIKVIEINPEYKRIAEIIGKENRLVVPISAKEKVLAAISAVSGIVTIHSDIGGEMQKAEEVISESKPHIHLLVVGDGLKVAMLVRPFAQGGPYYRPGTGGETVIAEIEGKRLQTRRDLKLEKSLASQVIDACPTIPNEANSDSEWLIEDPESCLEVLLELQALEDRIVLEWPEGEKIRISHRAGLNDFKLSIQRQNDWFAASGELRLNEDLVLDIQRLMELLAKSPSRFIPLGKGEFLALTEEFRKRLDELQSFSEKHGKGVRFHSLATLALEDIVDGVGQLEVDKHWKAHIKRLKEMQNLQPQLPSTLQTELRDYQMEGFQWLSRLAYWGVGACLADDMGLGKTIQALALILARATAGPTLVVAPTSVCMNWIGEVHKFAPTLNVIQLGSGDRQKILDNLQPLDMLVCSYGLLQQEDVAQMLANVEWQTIVLDEAQSIKNFATKRSQAAMNLQGGFKLITTGTPIENHLGELWNLFRFINPGLLGSLENFNQRFAIPIERHQDKSVRHKLKKLIQPFMLRRTKNQVLQELPSRTEIVLYVDLSPEEIAFYEALRQEAIAKLANSEVAAGQKHLQMLVEITKLRRACCNASLVMPDVGFKSSKLQLFGGVLSELLENRHKALVFSQFVDHLNIIRAYLDEQKINYQYLDGSTPANERKKRVDAFQSGEGDVFLISLKAGGTGLNLTAADYVIHMDPWWNPAVEDQASDRAHRIGQQRPVTIYRLVAKNTIEEKILDLHHQKRDLADSLLEGTDVSGKISTEALLKLIQES